MAEFTPNSVSERVVADTLKQFATNGAITKRAGYSYINGSLIPNALSPMLARAMRAGKVVRDGVAKTERFTANVQPLQVNNVTVQLQTNIGVHTRTLRNNGYAGTPGNDGLVNTNRKLIPSTTPFTIPLVELNDQPLFFPQMQLETMLFDETVETIANMADNEINAMDAYDLAKMTAYATWRGANGGGTGTDLATYDNLIAIDRSKAYDDLYMVKIMNQIDQMMAEGDKMTQLGTFRGRRALLLKNEVLGYLKSPKTGFVINAPASNELFWSPSFDTNEALTAGAQYRGSFRGYDAYEWNGTHQDLMEKYLGLESGALDGVLGIVSTPLSYAGGGVGKKAIKLLQSTEYDGVVAFPYTKFGGAAYRMIYLLVASDWTIPERLQSKLAPAPVKAPAKWDTDDTEPITRVLYDADGNPTGLETIMDYIKPNGDLTCNVIIKLVDANTGNAISNATLITTVDDSNSTEYSNSNGTYTVLVPKGKDASIAITATGYTDATVSVKSKQSDQWQYAVTQKLTPAASA